MTSDTVTWLIWRTAKCSPTLVSVPDRISSSTPTTFMISIKTTPTQELLMSPPASRTTSPSTSRSHWPVNGLLITQSSFYRTVPPRNLCHILHIFDSLFVILFRSFLFALFWPFFLNFSNRFFVSFFIYLSLLYNPSLCISFPLSVCLSACPVYPTVDVQVHPEASELVLRCDGGYFCL